MRKAITVSCIGAAIVLGTTTSAWAAAQPIDVHNCFTLPDIGTTCTDISGQSNTVTTPSGNMTTEAQTLTTITFTAPDGTVSTVSQTRRTEHLLVRKGETQSATIVQKSTFSRDGQDCTASFHQQVANNELIFSNFEVVCR
jgi:hypothetical protein